MPTLYTASTTDGPAFFRMIEGNKGNGKITVEVLEVTEKGHPITRPVLTAAGASTDIPDPPRRPAA